MAKQPNEDGERPSAATTPWQLRMYRKSLKKRQKVELITDMIGPLARQWCLLVTGGDNNGAINHQLRALGGRWAWAEMERDGIGAMEAFLEESVHAAGPEALPFPDALFERVVVIDVHEHVADVGPLNAEISRVLAPGGLAVVTTPNGNERLPVARLKRWVGMNPRDYGHVVQGYTTTQLAEMMEASGLDVVGRGAYSRFFTELAELAINFAYVKLLARRKSQPEVKEGTIAPSSEEQLRGVEKTYRAYAAVYPVVRAFSALDALVPGSGGYAVAVAARKRGLTP
ncbi:MAG: methyltransferase domain-containing protein [Gemmatimonadota bacterium]